MAYQNGVTNVGTAPTPICTPGPAGVLLANLSGTAAFVGGPGVVAASTAGGGIPIGTANVLIPLPARRGTPANTDVDDQLYGRVAAGSVSIAWLTSY